QFCTAVNFATGNNPTCVCAADFNNDGKPDIAASNNYSNSVSVFINCTITGTGEPDLEKSITITPNPSHGKFQVDCRMDGAFALYNSLGEQVITTLLAAG